VADIQFRHHRQLYGRHAKCVSTLILVTLILAFLAGNAASPGQPATVPLAPAQRDFSADIGGHNVRLWFDLGADASLTLSPATLDELRIKPTGPGHRFMDVKGNTLESRTFEVSHLRIGSAVFTNVPGIVDVHAPPLGEGYVGPSLFAKYRVVLDHRESKMTLIPPETPRIEQAGCIGTAVESLDGASKVQTDFGDLILVWDTGAGVSFIRKSRIDDAHARRESSCTYGAFPPERSGLWPVGISSLSVLGASRRRRLYRGELLC
jgi:Aspartyl protease